MNWEYKDHSNYPGPLIISHQEILSALDNDSFDTFRALTDTRAIHRHLFKDLVPPGHDYFAGHYRGENFPGLENCEVYIPGAAFTCCPSKDVAQKMFEFSDRVKEGLNELDALDALGYDNLVAAIAYFACEVAIDVCRIHPYANGNGHISRFMIVAIFRRYGYVMEDFFIDPRPTDPRYVDFLRYYDKGNKKPLVMWVMSLLEEED